MELLFAVVYSRKGHKTGLMWMLEAVRLMSSKAELSERSPPWSLLLYLPPSFLRWSLLLPEFSASLPFLCTAHPSKFQKRMLICLISINKYNHLLCSGHCVKRPRHSCDWPGFPTAIGNVCFLVGSDFCLEAYRIKQKLWNGSYKRTEPKWALLQI